MFWTLVVFVAVGGPSITVDGFSSPVDCAFAGEVNIKHVQVDHLGVPNKRAVFRCDKTGRRPVTCYPDTRTYGRTGECILNPKENTHV